MKFFRRTKFNLRFVAEEGTRVLHPGDVLVLTHNGHGAGDGGRKFSASVTQRYEWDGRTLKVMK